MRDLRPTPARTPPRDRPGASTTTTRLGATCSATSGTPATTGRLPPPRDRPPNRSRPVYEPAARPLAERTPRDEPDRHGPASGDPLHEQHTCQGWLEGYLLTGRHGLFSCYEAFVHIVDSMVNQHVKWLRVTRRLPWRAPIASLNYLLTSHSAPDHNASPPPARRPTPQQEPRSRTGLPAAGRQHPLPSDQRPRSRTLNVIARKPAPAITG
ncbi:hypothetical protein [Streptomyces sp. DHE17-7]|uniref:hypothetical protein n=1 Tax=Streptomyces sp. DHE17-7 TaxID=2759949 RepID=UPI0022EA48FF|nr:hypothetical protein [Streptomyces sp. DHE17-7]